MRSVQRFNKIDHKEHNPNILIYSHTIFNSILKFNHKEYKPNILKFNLKNTSLIYWNILELNHEEYKPTILSHSPQRVLPPWRQPVAVHGSSRWGWFVRLSSVEAVPFPPLPPIPLSMPTHFGAGQDLWQWDGVSVVCDSGMVWV